MPGALEIVPAIAIAVDAAEKQKKPYDGVVALGCVIQGETFHFDIVAMQSARALMDFSVARRLPFGNGILTVDTEAQAWARARIERAGQGRRRRARGAGADRDQAAARQEVTSWPKRQHRTTDAAPTAAARRGLPPCRRSTRWIWRRRRCNDILAEFESHWLGREVEGEQYLPAEAAFFRDVVGGVVAEQRRLDPMIDAALAKGWPLKRIETVLRAVLRAGAYELDRKPDVPARVVVSEYVDVANAFVDRDETGMVNAVLDQLARQLRAGEFDAAAG